MHTQAAGLGERLRQIRERAGLSQRELARRAGVPNSSVSNVEQGRVSPSVDMLSRLLAPLPLSLTQFFSDPLEAPQFFSLAGQMPGLDLAPAIDHRTFASKEDSGSCVAHWTPSALMLVLEGALQVSVGQEVRTLKLGEGVRVWPGTAYRCTNTTEAVARLLIIHA